MWGRYRFKCGQRYNLQFARKRNIYCICNMYWYTHYHVYFLKSRVVFHQKFTVDHPDCAQLLWFKYGNTDDSPCFNVCHVHHITTDRYSQCNETPFKQSVHGQIQSKRCHCTLLGRHVWTQIYCHQSFFVTSSMQRVLDCRCSCPLTCPGIFVDRKNTLPWKVSCESYQLPRRNLSSPLFEL